jgi:hypothetical protein
LFCAMRVIAKWTDGGIQSRAEGGRGRLSIASDGTGGGTG